MKCLTCDIELSPKKPRGRKKLYCSRACNPNAYQPKNAGLSNCQNCGRPLADVGQPGRPKRNCSRKCRSAATKKLKPLVERPCRICQKAFYSNNPNHAFCCRPFYALGQKNLASQRAKQRTEAKYPNRERTAPCGWCGELRTFKIGESVVNAYHPACTKEAERARYRIKTVKRQKHKNPNRISHEQVVREYGSDCHICNEPIDLTLPRTSKLGLTVDHLIPLSRGGTDTMPNLRPAHWGCNIKKSNKLMEELSAQSR